MIPHEAAPLEYDRLKEILDAYAVSTSGKARVQALQPTNDLAWIQSELQAADEAKTVEHSHNGFPLQGLSDIALLLGRLEKGATLDPEGVREVGSHLRVSRRVQQFLTKLDVGTTFPEVARRCRTLAVFPALEKRIEQTVGPEGDILDDASPELRRIRQAIHRTRQQIHDRLESYLRQSSYENAIQERVVTMRNDRYVIPVKQEFRAQIPGVFQGQSSSGATLFVEPLPVVEMNNALHEFHAREALEIERILRELSNAMRLELDGLRANADVLAELDFLRAKARFCLDYRCVSPVVEPSPRVDLKGARHPLLEYHIKQERRANPTAPSRAVVPTDIALGDGDQGVVVTGPNTGGKTVVLKTVGLLALMAQSGLPVPANCGSVLSVFDGVFADIGGEQSLEQSLSTFSSHLNRIIRILNATTPRTLVLLDEIGAGTDPDEGVALATALLDAFLERGALFLVTTHYGALKAFAHSHPRLRNASMEFDEATLSPTYRLRVGLPGSSHALRVAERLGLPSDVLDNARSRVGDKSIAIEDLIADVERIRRELEGEQKALRESLANAEAKEALYTSRLEEFKTVRAELIRKAEADASIILRDARSLVERTVGELRRANASRDAIRDAHREVADAQAELRRRLELREESAPSGDAAQEIVAGTPVYVKTMRAEGEAMAEPDERGMLRVRVGSMTISLHASDLTRRDKPSEPKRCRDLSLQSAKSSAITRSLTLIGERVSAALDMTDKYLDDAVLSGLTEVILVHGKGTGALRAALHTFLRSHPHVASFRLGTHAEGGAGVTVVTLRE
jgi:DNA mismatch repair protein MutS2